MHPPRRLCRHPRRRPRRIAELKADHNLQAWSGLAKIREAQTGAAPLAHLSAPALRQLIAEHEYDHRPVEATEAVDDIPF